MSKKPHPSIIFSALIAVVVLFFSCSEERPKITGNLISLPDGKVWLYTYADSLAAIDSTESYEGRFSFTQPDMLPDILFLNFESYPDFYLPAITDGGDIFISGNFNYMDDIRVSGTEANDALREYAASIRDFDIMIRAIDLELNSWHPTGTPEDSASYTMMASKRDSLKVIITDSRMRFVNRNPSSIVSAMFLNASMNDSMTIFQVDSLIGQLDTAMVDNAFVRRMEQRSRELAN